MQQLHNSYFKTHKMLLALKGQLLGESLYNKISKNIIRLNPFRDAPAVKTLSCVFVKICLLCLCFNNNKKNSVKTNTGDPLKGFK